MCQVVHQVNCQYQCEQHDSKATMIPKLFRSQKVHNLSGDLSLSLIGNFVRHTEAAQKDIFLISP